MTNEINATAAKKARSPRRTFAQKVWAAETQREHDRLVSMAKARPSAESKAKEEAEQAAVKEVFVYENGQLLQAPSASGYEFFAYLPLRNGKKEKVFYNTRDANFYIDDSSRTTYLDTSKIVLTRGAEALAGWKGIYI